MNYHDHQTAAIGDAFTIGTFGTCRIVSLAPDLATVRNVCTGELFELDDLTAADLIERAPRPPSPLTAALFSAESVAHLRGYEREILPLADLARGMALHIEEQGEALRSCLEWMEHTIEQLGTHDKGTRLNWGGPIAKARAVLAKTPAPLAPEMLTSKD